MGVAGPTGAGKTSILNALLDIPELLPSSARRAATASVCCVSWNASDDPSQLFRAEVIYRHKDDVREELEDLLADLRQLRKLDAELSVDPMNEANVEERFELNERITDRIDTICATWGVGRKEMEDEHMTTGIIFDRKHDIHDVLGTTASFCSLSREHFTTCMKPYLDSTVGRDGTLLWPLIREVRLYVKSDILKHGITLVDLPGLSDRNEKRAAIAKGFFHKLTILMSVAASTRASDEKTSADIFRKNCLTRSQEISMKLDGKFNKQGFCVIASKSDEIDTYGFCQNEISAQADVNLQQNVREKERLRAKSWELEAEIQAVTRLAKGTKKRRAGMTETTSGTDTC